MAETNPTDTARAPLDATSGPIDAMHAQWDTANTVYAAAEAVSFSKEAGDDAKARAELATSAAFHEATAIHLAILRQRPRSVREALILATHIAVSSDAGLRSLLHDGEVVALEYAIETLTAFLATHPDAGEPLGGWGGDMIAILIERVNDRTIATNGEA